MCGLWLLSWGISLMLGCLGTELYSNTIYFLSLHQEETLEVNLQELKNAHFFDVALWDLNCALPFQALPLLTHYFVQESSLNNMFFCCGQLQLSSPVAFDFTTSFFWPPHMCPQPFSLP